MVMAVFEISRPSPVVHARRVATNIARLPELLKCASLEGPDQMR
jgi:hypothetical protein